MQHTIGCYQSLRGMQVSKHVRPVLPNLHNHADLYLHFKIKLDLDLHERFQYIKLYKEEAKVLCSVDAWRTDCWV